MTTEQSIARAKAALAHSERTVDRVSRHLRRFEHVLRRLREFEEDRRARLRAVGI